MASAAAAVRASLLCPRSRAKAKVVGQKKIARQDLGGMAMVSALDELYGFGYQRWEEEESEYEAVQLEDIQRVARTYLSSDRLVHVTVGPEDKGDEEVEK